MNEPTPQERRARDRYEMARKALQAIRVNDKVAEEEFKLAYQGLVRLGLAGQIKRKYRGGR